MRKPRELGHNSTYHVTARINRGEMLFGQKDYYKELLLEYVKRAKSKYSFLIRNICIMDNHVHIQIKPAEDEQLGNIMKSILGGFARRFNSINNLKGHVWYDRYKSKIIRTYIQFYRTYLYIANNPVRANMVSHPLEYKFSGFPCVFSTNVYSNRSTLEKILYAIIDPPGLKIQKAVLNYLSDYSKDEASKTNREYGFFDKRPGRSRKN